MAARSPAPLCASTRKIQVPYLNTFQSLWEYKESFLAGQIDIDSPIGPACPLCGRLHCYRKIAPYWRYAVELFPEFRKERIPVARFLCRKRQRRFSLLPVQLIPYFQYTVGAVQRSEGIVIVRDLTERKVAEKKIERAYFELREAKEYLENIISTTVDGIITTDPQGVIERSNESIEVMTGYREDELKGLHISHLSLHRADRGHRQTMNRMVTELFRDGRVTGIESVWKGKNGLHVPIEANAALLKDKKGIVAGGVVGVRDVRERKKLEKMKNDFISNISHELRTPLTSIKGSIDNLLDGIAGHLNEGQREYLTIINAESNRLVRLIDDLLDLNSALSGNRLAVRTRASG